ncbi:MAG: hypothetical protein LBG07_06475 [Treponema sp.]|nr:hypothetical protein [Treponema sp.]
MKTVLFGCMGAALVFLFGSCVTATPSVDSSTMNIANPDISIAPLTPEDYTVLGTVSGSGKVSFNSGTGEYTGDTLKYGSLGGLGSIGHINTVTTSSGPFGLFQSTQNVVNTPSNSREMAIGNATYALIEQAKALNADAVIFVTTAVESTGDASAKTTTTTATVKGTAIKLK